MYVKVLTCLYLFFLCSFCLIQKKLRAWCGTWSYSVSSMKIYALEQIKETKPTTANWHNMLDSGVSFVHGTQLSSPFGRGK